MSEENQNYIKLEMTEKTSCHTLYLRPIEEQTFEYRLLRKKDGTLCLQRAFIKYKNMLEKEYEVIWKDVETVKEFVE